MISTPDRAHETLAFQPILADAARRSDETHDVDPEMLAALRASGLLGALVPTGYGGMGLTPGEGNRILTEVARSNPSAAIMLAQHYAVSLRIVEDGTDGQRHRYLPKAAAGDFIFASSWSEAKAGADKRNLATRGVPLEGADWLLTGAKTYTTNATCADLILVLVQTGDPTAGPARVFGASGQTFFLVEAETPGVAAANGMRLAGMRGSGTGFVTLEQVRVGADQVLGEVGGATRVMADIRRSGITLGAVSVGIAQGALAVAGRRVGDLPPDSDDRPRLRHLLADLHARVLAAEALVREVGRREGDVGVLTLASKVFASEVSEEVCREVQQLCGGGGFASGAEIERLVRDARALALMGPVNDLARKLIAEGVLS